MADPVNDAWSVDEGAFPRSGSLEDQAAFLVRYAVLAPSSHNTQPWDFRVRGGRIDLHADVSRWLRIADPDQRELYLSVGCALENLVLAARHFGFSPAVEEVPNVRNAALVARVELGTPSEGAGPALPASVFDAILRRHTHRREYDGRPVPPDVRAALEALATEPGVEIHLTDDPAVRRRVDGLVLRADAVQFADPEWRRELGYWLGLGVFGTGWLLSRAAGLAVSHLDLGGPVGRKDGELLRSASLLGLVAVERVDRRSRVRAGRVFERLFLAATAAGLALQPMNQVLQVAEVRESFEALLPPGWGTPQITFRLGRAEPEEHAPRRPLEEVLRRCGGPGVVPGSPSALAAGAG